MVDEHDALFDPWPNYDSEHGPVHLVVFFFYPNSRVLMDMASRAWKRSLPPKFTPEHKSRLLYSIIRCLK